METEPKASSAPPVPPRVRSLVLIGFMGTGKSSVGRKVAASLGFRFVDSDDVVVQLSGKRIPRLFAEEGEETFRDWETRALRHCLENDGQVVATGGGIVVREENRELLKRAGHVIWLKADPESIFRRVAHNRERPLLRTADPLATIRELFDSRVALGL